MPMMNEHLDAGFKAGVVLSGLVLAMYKAGFIVESWYDFVGFAAFGSIALVVGSDLPDIDAKSVPISKLFVILVPGSVLLALLGRFDFPLLQASVITGLSFLAYTKLMPPHRGFVHTIRAGLIVGGVLALLLIGLLGLSLKISLWTGLSLVVGHLIHLWKDGWVRV